MVVICLWNSCVSCYHVYKPRSMPDDWRNAIVVPFSKRNHNKNNTFLFLVAGKDSDWRGARDDSEKRLSMQYVICYK